MDGEADPGLTRIPGENDLVSIAREPINWVETEAFGCHTTAFALDADPADAWEEGFASQTRLYLGRIVRQPPCWLIQGISACLATADFLPNGDVVAGRLDHRCTAWLEHMPALPWPAFFQSIYGFVDRPGAADPTAAFYTQAWLVTHAILLASERGRSPQDLRNLCRNLHGDEGDESVVEAWLGLSPGGLSAGLRRIDPTQAVFIHVNGPALRRQLHLGSLTTADQGAMWYDVIADTDSLAAANALSIAKRIAPASPNVLASEARQALRGGDFSRAAGFYRQAIAAGCQDGYAYYASARQRLDE